MYYNKWILLNYNELSVVFHVTDLTFLLSLSSTNHIRHKGIHNPSRNNQIQSIYLENPEYQNQTATTCQQLLMPRKKKLSKSGQGRVKGNVNICRLFSVTMFG